MDSVSVSASRLVSGSLMRRKIKRRKTSGTRVTIHPRPATIRFSRENLKRCLITKEPNIKNCGWMENESAKCEVWKIRSMEMRSVENEEYGK